MTCSIKRFAHAEFSFRTMPLPRDKIKISAIPRKFRAFSASSARFAATQRLRHSLTAESAETSASAQKGFQVGFGVNFK